MFLKKINLITKLVWLGLLFFTVSLAAYDVTSNAFELDLSSNLLVLSGDVQMATGPYIFSAPQTRYEIDNQQIMISESFQIRNRAQIIQGSHLEMDNQNAVLTASEMDMSFQKYRLTGRNVRSGSSAIRMEKVRITSCKGEPPVLHLNSDEVVLYPQWGFLVAFNSFFHIKGVPVFYFPAYFMGDRRQDIYSQNRLIPEMGSSPKEGGFVKEDVPYYINESNHGSIRAGYLEKFGLQVGVQHYAIFQEGQSHGSIALYYNPVFWQGHVVYTTSLFNDFKREQDVLGFLFNSGMVKITQSNAYLTVAWHENELINNQFVSQKPRYSFNSILGITPQDNIDFSVDQAVVQENQSTTNKKTSWSAAWQSNYPLPIGVLDQKLQYIVVQYAGIGDHQRFQQNWSITIPFDGWTVISDYEHLYYFNGTSPFLYDQYQIDPYDKIGLTLKMGVGPLDLETRWRRRVGENYDYSRRVQLSLPYEKCLEFQLYWEDVDKVMGLNIQL